jgi:hypothetical protein
MSARHANGRDSNCCDSNCCASDRGHLNCGKSVGCSLAGIRPAFCQSSIDLTTDVEMLSGNFHPANTQCHLAERDIAALQFAARCQRARHDIIETLPVADRALDCAHVSAGDRRFNRKGDVGRSFASSAVVIVCAAVTMLTAAASLAAQAASAHTSPAADILSRATSSLAGLEPELLV